MSRSERHKKKKSARNIWRTLLFALVTLLLSAALAYLGFWLGYKKDEPSTSQKPKKPRTQKVISEPRVVSPLTGMKVLKEDINRQPVVVTIDNSPAARPQSGIGKADIVYEMLAEGPITRLMAVFLDQDSPQVGPVRSARSYFIKSALEYEPIYVHAGGSDQAFNDIAKYEVQDLDGLNVGGKVFWRSNDRKAPHNLYTSTTQLRKAAANKGYEKNKDLHPFKFLKDGEENPAGVKVPYLTIQLLGGALEITYKYESSSDSYLRFNGKAPHRDDLTGRQIKAKNVIVQFVNTRVIDESKHRSMELIGEGKMLFFSQGKLYRGTWSKDSARAQTTFHTDDGTELKLNPGQTWIQMVPLRTQVDYPLEGN